MIFATKEGPLSLWRDFGRPNRGGFSFCRDLWTWDAFSDPVQRLKLNPWRCQQIPGDIWILTVELFGWNLTVSLPEYVPLCEVTRRGSGEPASYYGQQITGKSHLFYCSLKSLLWKGLLPQVPLWICHVLGDIMQTHGELLLWGPRDEQLVILHIPDNVSFLIAPLFSLFLLPWGIMKKAGEPWGGQLPRPQSAQAPVISQAALCAVWSTLLFP